MSCARCEPMTFRRPISFALRSARAVARLMKLMQARRRTKAATAEKV